MRARSTILGFAVLTILLTAGAAQSLSGSNTVFSDDIVDTAVKTADLGTNSVTRVKVADNAIAGSEIINNSVSGAEIADGSLDARDIAIARGTHPFDFGSIAGGTCLGIVVGTGIQMEGNIVIASPSQELPETNSLIYSYQDSTTATGFRFKVCNISASPIDPPPATLSWTVIDNNF